MNTVWLTIGNGEAEAEAEAEGEGEAEGVAEAEVMTVCTLLKTHMVFPRTLRICQ